MSDIREWNREDWKAWLRLQRLSPTKFAAACNISATTFDKILAGRHVHENTWGRVEPVYQHYHGEPLAAG